MKDEKKNNSEKLLRSLDPAYLKDNLMASSLYIALFESFKDYVVETLKMFYFRGYKDGKIILSADYGSEVEGFSPKHPPMAALKWLEERGAIDADDLAHYDRLRQFRNELVHKLLDRLFEGMPEDLPSNTVALLALRIKIEKWWILNIEIPTSGDYDADHDIDEDKITTGTEMMSQMIFDMLSDDERRANFYKDELAKKIKADDSPI
jgi:hypothetical protein